MFPSRINLLSKQKQAHLQRLLYFQFIKNTLESFLIVLSVAGIVILGAQLVLQNFFFDLTKEITQTSQQKIAKNSQIKQVNRLLTKVDALQENYTLWTPIIADIAQSIPDKITLQSLSLDAKSNSYTLVGLADTRDALLQMVDDLKKIDYIESVDIPLEQLTSKINVSFSIVAKGNQL
jgi:Tfp pilus assembly protein PilN